MRCTVLFVAALSATVMGQPPTPATVETSERDRVIDAQATKLSAGYVLPDAIGRITRALRTASRAGEYDGKTPKEFVDAINRTLLTASHDKHLSVYHEPAPAVSPGAATPSMEPRNRLNFGFGKLERLRGNTPMAAFVATYFFDTTRVHLTDIYWRDTNETNQFWTTTFVPGRRAARQPLYILTSTSTFSAAEDFCYALQNLKRALVVGETTGGGAHSSRGPQRLTPSFTAIIPAGRSVSADASLGVAHLHALRSLLEKEPGRQWKQTLQQVTDDLSRSISVP